MPSTLSALAESINRSSTPRSSASFLTNPAHTRRNFIEINFITSNRLFLEDCAHVLQYGPGPLIILSNVGQSCPDFSGVGRRSGGKAFCCLRVAEDRRQRLG